MSKNKVISIIVVISMLLGINAMAVKFQDVPTVHAHAKEIEIITALGLMQGNQDGTFQPMEAVTRADFAQIISVLYQKNQNTSSVNIPFLENEENQSKEEVPLPNARFSDVPISHWAYQEIEEVAQRNIMSGSANGLFEPDRGVLEKEAVKTMIKILGYEPKAIVNGGYPMGYIIQANELEMLDGIRFEADKVMNRGDMAALLYNCFQVELLQNVTVGESVEYKTEKGKTLLTEIMGLYKLVGLLTQNEVSNFTGQNGLNRHAVTVDHTVIKVNSQTRYINDMLGYIVEVYYSSEDGINDNQMVYGTISSKNQTTVIDGGDIDSYQSGVLSYYKNGKLSSMRIPNGTPMIFNGVAISSYTSDHFTMQDGSVTVIQNNSNCDLLIVKKYETMILSSVDEREHEIYNKMGSAGSRIKLHPEEECKLTILGVDGQKRQFESLSTDLVVSAAINGDIAELILSNTVLTGEITAMNESDEPSIVIDNKEYIYSTAFKQCSEAIKPAVGKKVTVYLDAFGKIAWINLQKSGDLESGIVMKSNISESISKKREMKIFTAKGQKKVYELADKVIVDNASGISQNLKDTALSNYINGLTGFIKFRVNEDGKITKIEIPLEKQMENTLRCYKLLKTDANFQTIQYRGSIQGFGGKAYLNDNTVVFSVCEDAQEDDQYSIASNYIFEDNAFYEVTAYSSIPDSNIAEVLIYKTSTAKSAIDPLDNQLMVVSSIVQAADADGIVVDKVRLFAHGNEITLNAERKYTNSKGESCSAFGVATDPLATGATYQVKAGDIIRYSTNVSNGYVKDVQLVYDSDLANPSGGKPGFLAGIHESQYFIKKGYINTDADSTRLYEIINNADTLSNCNPYAVTGKTTPNYRAYMYNAPEVRTMLGFAYHVDGNYVKVTTQDLNIETYRPSGIPTVLDETSYPGFAGVYIIDTFNLKGFLITTVEYYNDGKVKVKRGQNSDIMSYKNGGRNCSKILALTDYGEARQFIIINDYRN